jgi:hypothetical protein
VYDTWDNLAAVKVSVPSGPTLQGAVAPPPPPEPPPPEPPPPDDDERARLPLAVDDACPVRARHAAIHSRASATCGGTSLPPPTAAAADAASDLREVRRLRGDEDAEDDEAAALPLLLLLGVVPRGARAWAATEGRARAMAALLDVRAVASIVALAVFREKVRSGWVEVDDSKERRETCSA